MGTPKIVVMGVSGSGKSTLGQLLAQALSVPYVEGDALHPQRNVERMAAGTPLTDEDRQGWLQAVAAQLATPQAQTRGVVVTCSALKRSYRDVLRLGAADVQFIVLHGDHGLLAQRMSARQGHYMPASLLQSQLDTLEMPGNDERATTLDIRHPSDVLLKQALLALHA